MQDIFQVNELYSSAREVYMFWACQVRKTMLQNFFFFFLPFHSQKIQFVCTRKKTSASLLRLVADKASVEDMCTSFGLKYIPLLHVAVEREREREGESHFNSKSN